ncbi:MAG: rod shape-determining protein MreC [Candidatus Margulisiibacteriota bacterium]
MKKFIIILVFTVILAFLLSYFQSLWIDNPAIVNSRSVLFTSISSVSSFTSGIFDGISNSFSNTASLFNTGRRIKTLELKYEEQAVRQSQYEVLQNENVQLREELRYKNKDLCSHKIIAAEVVARGMDTWFDTVIIDRGWKDGVETDYAVVNTDGLVGRVIETAEHRSKVMLLINPNSSISAVVLDTSDKGIIQGRGLNTLVLKYIPHSSVLTPDAPVYTSGLSIVFPKGFLIGYISKIIKKKYEHLQYVEVKPAVRFSAIDRVWVIAERANSEESPR